MINKTVMKYLAKHPLYEDVKLKKVEALDFLHSKGLIDEKQYHVKRFKLDPGAYFAANLDLQFDWHFAAQTTSREALQLLKERLIEEEAHSGFPAGCIVDYRSLDIDRWRESDWVDRRTGEPNYWHDAYVRFRLICKKGEADRSKIESWAEELTGRVFSNLEIIFEEDLQN
jgi:hypothetical protein